MQSLKLSPFLITHFDCVNVTWDFFFTWFQSRMHWSRMERWLQQRCEEVHPGYGDGGILRVLGYQWRVLRFNDDTRQSTAKVMLAYNQNKPDLVYLMQQPHCLAVPCTLLNLYLM